MQKSLKKMIRGYKIFKKKYAHGNRSVMRQLSLQGQKPEIMVLACCDSRVDPALLLQCAPGDLFVIRNVANIIPPYEKDEMHHGTSAALEFGICYLKVKHFILLGHSQCGGINAFLHNYRKELPQNDFITDWVSLVKIPECLGEEHFSEEDLDQLAKTTLKRSYKNCMAFPWIENRVNAQKLKIHLWFLDLRSGQIYNYSEKTDSYHPLDN